MSLSLALALLVILTALIAVTALLRHIVGCDGYGLRPPPRSHIDETHGKTYAGLPG
jgi:hypothetical protein